MNVICARCDRSASGSEDALPDGWQRHTSGTTGARYCVCPDCLPGAAGKSIASGDVSANDDRLRLFIERIERLEEEKRGISDDIREVYSEAKSTGYDAKIMREIVKLRALAPHDRAERDAILETYRAALGMA